MRVWTCELDVHGYEYGPDANSDVYGYEYGADFDGDGDGGAVESGKQSFSIWGRDVEGKLFDGRGANWVIVWWYRIHGLDGLHAAVLVCLWLGVVESV